MRTVVIGDIHGRSNWKLAIYQEEPVDRVIFIGDYFDSFDISGLEQIHNFKEIIHYKKTNPQVEVVLLLGNHDMPYYPGFTDTAISGYQHRMAPSISQVIEENKEHLQMAYGFDEYLFTHAGVSPSFMDGEFSPEGWVKENVVKDLNELLKYRPSAFEFNGVDGSGDNTYQTPIWIRPRSLMSINKKHEKGLKKDYIQIVGHTQMRQLDLVGSDKFTGGRYYFIDTMDTSGDYLIIEDNKLRTNSVK